MASSAHGRLKHSTSAVMPVESSPKHSNFSTGATLKASSFDPETPVVSVLVQGRFDGPVERYRVASRQMCCASKTLGWAAVVVGAGEIAVGVVVFSQWLREGGWWAGLLGILSGIAGTGITADTPVGTSLFTWLVALSFVSFLTSLVTLISLDGARWLDTKDIEACVPSFDAVCPSSHCTCTTSDQLWDRCFEFGDPQSASDCDVLESTSSSLLASSLALLFLAVISTLLFALGVKCKYLGGGVERWGRGGSSGSGGSETRPSGAAKAPVESY